MRSILFLTMLVAACSRDQPPPAATRAPPASLVSTSWQLVKFQGGDGTVLTPSDPTKYTIRFESDSGVSLQVDCNRGHGSWRSTPPNGIEFGPLALTRAMCPPESLHDLIVRQWPYVRSYVIKDGHLFLSLVADGGIFEFEPRNGR